VTTDDILRLRFESENDRSLADTIRQLGETRQAVERLDVSTRGLNVAKRENQRATKESTYGMMQLAGAMDDLQYVGEQGLRPILNNISVAMPGLAVGLITATAAVAGARMAFSALSGAMDATDFAGMAGDVDALKKRVDELGGSYLSTAQDARELEAAQKALRDAEAADKIMASPTPATTSRSKAFDEAVKVQGPGALQALLSQAIQDSFAGGGAIDMIQEALQSGLIDRETAVGVGLAGAGPRQISNFLDSAPASDRALIRSIVTQRESDRLFTGLQSGDQGSFSEFQRLLAGSNAGRVGEGGAFASPVLQSLFGQRGMAGVPGRQRSENQSFADAILAANNEASTAQGVELSAIGADNQRLSDRQIEEQRRAAEVNARRIGGVFQTRFGGQLQSELANGADPFEARSDIADALTSQGADRAQALEEAARIVEETYSRIEIDQARADAAFMEMMQATLRFGQGQAQRANQWQQQQTQMMNGNGYPPMMRRNGP
jgi:hypothetical protein